MYLYRMTIYKSDQRVIGLPANNDTNKTDFETNHKSTAVKVDSLIVSETTFVIDKNYTDFSAMVVSPLTWGDVKYTENDFAYDCYLLNEG